MRRLNNNWFFRVFVGIRECLLVLVRDLIKVEIIDFFIGFFFWNLNMFIWM